MSLLGTPRRAEASDVEHARALFDEAGELERQGQWGAAQERLRDALRIRETAHLHFALGWALENDDKLLEAKAEYETAVKLGRDRTGSEEPARLATTRLAEIEKALPVIKVRLAGTPKAATRVIVDGREVKRDADVATAPVNPGSHVVRVERDGDAPTEQIVYVARGNVRSISVDNPAAPREVVQDRHGRAPLPPSSSRSKETEDHGDRILPWLLLSGGLTMVAGGSALVVSGHADSERPGSAGVMTTKEAGGWVLGGAGLVSSVAGVVLLLRTDTKPVERNAPRSTSRAAIDGALLPGGGMATASFAF